MFKSCRVRHLRQSTLRSPASFQGDATILRPTGRIAPHLRLLPITGTIRYVQYEWDNGKAATNLRKHGVDFPMPLQPSKTRTASKRSTPGLFTTRSGFRSSAWLAARYCS